MNENRNTPTEQVIGIIHTTLAQPIKVEQGVVELVGSWIWIEFPTKPSPELRQALKDTGFFWNPKREAWCHSGGNHTWHSKSDPRFTYQIEQVSL